MQLLCESASAGNRADIGGNHDHILALLTELLGIVVHEDGVAVQVIHGDIKEALNLCCMEVHGQHAVCTSGGNHVCHQLGGDGVACLSLAVLTSIAKVGDNSGDTASTGATHRINHNEQFHQIVVDGIAGGLHDEHIGATHRLINRSGNLAICKVTNFSIAQLNTNQITNVLCQTGVGIAGENLHVLTVRNHFQYPLFFILPR